MTIRTSAAFCFLCVSAMAQQGSPYEYTPTELRNHFLNAASAHSVKMEDLTLKLQKRPLMNWSNPVRKSEQGSLFVWTDKGRPQALASIFTYGSNNKTFCRHEMISVSERPLNSMLNGRTVWNPSKPGLVWQAVRDVTPPAVNRSRRLLQMRTIARQFTGVLHNPGIPPVELTLMPQPLHQWHSDEHQIVDGGLFAFAVATDPELFLLIEAAGSTPKWQYAVVRSHFFGLDMKKDGAVVKGFGGLSELTMTRAGQAPWSSEPYFIFFEDQAIPPPETLR